MKKVGIITVGYKDYVNRFLSDYRDSLRKQTYPKELTNIYIVDNCSINNCEYARKHFPEATCIPRDDGNYAAGNNCGLKAAREDGCELFVIANMDTVFEPTWLEELVEAVMSDRYIGVAQSKMLLYSDTDKEKKNPRINSLGNIQHFLGFGFTDSYNELDREIEGMPEIKGYASGCSFIIKKKVLERAGVYDEEYYMYHDDVEMGWRIKLSGYKAVLAPKSVMYHKYEFGRSILMLYYMERNRYLAMFHYYKWETLILLAPAIIGMEAGMIFYSFVNGWWKTKFKVTAYFLLPSTWIKIFKKRKEVSRIRKLEDKDVVKDFAGKVLFQEIDNPVLKYIANPIFDLYWKLARKLIKW